MPENPNMTRYLLPAALLAVAVLGGGLHSGCSEPPLYTPIGTDLAGPIDITAAPGRNFFYVLNSDPSRDHNEGSLLVVDADGKPVSAIPFERLSNSLRLIGNLLFVQFNAEELPNQKRPGGIRIFDVSTPDQPVEISAFVLDRCSPINTVGSVEFGRYFISCKGGRIFSGAINPDLTVEAPEIFRIPDGKTRRAMYLDTVNRLFYAFVTDLGEPVFEDRVLADKVSYDSSFNEISGSNEVPDLWEKNRTVLRRNASLREQYQFLLVDLDVAASSDYGYRLPDEADPILASEKRYIYFNLQSLEGEPDFRLTAENEGAKYYRTNFWEAVSDSSKPGAFYLSHRGAATRGRSVHSNQIVHVQLLTDPRPQVTVNEDGSKSYAVKPTSELFDFKRVYGFAGIQNQPGSYPKSFQIAEIEGEQVFLVNHFRSVVDFEQPHFRLSMAPAQATSGTWYQQVISANPNESYNAFTVGRNGRILATSFYGNRLFTFDLSISEGFKKL